MKARDCTYIVIKGFDWLNSRLDIIGYPDVREDRRQLQKYIWSHETRKVPQSLADKIIGRCEK